VKGQLWSLWEARELSITFAALGVTRLWILSKLFFQQKHHIVIQTMATQQSPESSAPARTKKQPNPTSNGKNSKLPERLPGETKAALQQYGRGGGIPVHSIKDKKLRGNMKKLEYRYKDAALKAKDSEMLLAEERGYVEAEGMEKTYKFTQKELGQAVDIATAQKVLFTSHNKRRN
jgi:hypothetical protein